MTPLTLTEKRLIFRDQIEREGICMSETSWKFDGDFITNEKGRTVCQFFNKYEEDFEDKKQHAALIVQAVNSRVLLQEAEDALESIYAGVPDWLRKVIGECGNTDMVRIHSLAESLKKVQDVVLRLRAAREVKA